MLSNFTLDTSWGLTTHNIYILLIKTLSLWTPQTPMTPMPLVVCLCCNLQWHAIFYFRRHRDAPGAAGTLVVPPWCSWYHESDPLTPSRPALALSPRRKVWGIQEGSKTAATLIYSKNTPWSWPPAPPTPIWMQPNWTYTHFLIFLALFRPHQFLRNFLNFFWLSCLPYPSWVHCTHRFFTMITQTRVILIFIIFFSSFQTALFF
jgi:hypothetical protein